MSSVNDDVNCEEDVDFGNLISTLNLCYLPEQKHEIDQPLQPEQFTDHIANTENNLGMCLSILSKVYKSRSQNIPKEVIMNVVLLGGEYHKPDLWSSTRCVFHAEHLIKRLLEIYDYSSVSCLLLNNKVSTFFLALRPKLDKNSWKKHPAAVSSFVWILSNLKCPYLGDHIDWVMPTCLLLVDDHETDNKIIGLNCLLHLAQNVSRAELRQYGRGLVIYHAIEHLPYSPTPALLRALVPCLTTLLGKTEHNAVTVTLHWNRFDDLMMVWLRSMEMQQNLELREVYVSGLLELLQAMGLTCVRWSKQLLDVISEYCEHNTTRNQSLECLYSFIEAAWPRITHNFTRVTVIALKVLMSVVHQDPKQHVTIPSLQKLFQKLEKISGNKFQEFVRDLENSTDLKELVPFITSGT